MRDTFCELRQQIIRLTLIGLTMVATPQVSQGQTASARRPNIVVILADDMGYADVGFHGCQDIPTPHIDSIATAGVRCTNGYVSGPYCSPTRAGLLTGRYQQRFGHEFNPAGGPRGAELGLATTETTMADRLQAAGYATALLGKWHLGTAPRFHPQQRGFQEFFGFLGGQHTYWNHDQATLLRGTTAIQEPLYLTDALGREAVNFVERHADRPFFLYLSFNAVHTPMEVDEPRLQKFTAINDPRRQKYAAMLSAMDDAIGTVLSALEQQGLVDDTLIFFMSDNGGAMMQGTTINGSSNAPLRGAKRTTLEGGIRVPFVVQWPGKLPAGAVYEQPVIQLDVQSTALAAAGISIEPEWQLDGVNLLPFLSGKQQAAPHAALYWRLGAQRAVRAGDWKLVQYDLTIDGQADQGVSSNKLYHLANDPGEAHDLAEQEPEKLRELNQLWDAWNAQLPAP